LITEKVFEPQPSLEDSDRFEDHPGFTSLDFEKNIFYRESLSALRPNKNLEEQVFVFISPNDRVAQLYPRYRVPFSSPSMTCTQGYDGGILNRLHKELYKKNVLIHAGQPG
jgi:hypothetical protein